MEQRLAYTAATINRVASYLATKPYSEVVALIDELKLSAVTVDIQNAIDEESTDGQ